MKIIAVDPGGTTGLAYWDTAVPFERPMWAKQEPRERADTLPMVEDFAGWAQRFGDDLVFVCEEFKITARTAQLSQQYTALEVIGNLKFIKHLYSSGLVLQRPADAKRFTPDKRLRAAGLWHPGGGGHGNDAARHLFIYLAKHGLVDVAAVDRAGHAG